VDRATSNSSALYGAFTWRASLGGAEFGLSGDIRTRSPRSARPALCEHFCVPSGAPAPIPSGVDQNRALAQSSLLSGPPLIINSGLLPGMLACWAEGVVRPTSSRRGHAATPSNGDGGGGGGANAPIAWFPPDDRPARECRRSAVTRQVELCSLAGFSERVVMRFEPPAHAGVQEAISSGARDTAMLLSAAIEAASLGLSRVVWPIHAGAAREISVDALADICDRALLVGQLVGLDVMRADAGGGSIRIETPYADLTDAQLMDLALDMDAPLSAAWWCMNENDRLCGHCAGCMRWREALAEVDRAGRLDIQVLTTTPADVSPIGPLKQT
jgi:hypothetical protein